MFQGDAFQGDTFQDGPQDIQDGASNIFVIAYDLQPWIAPNVASSLYFQNPALDVPLVNPALTATSRLGVASSSNLFVPPQETATHFLGRFTASKHSILSRLHQNADETSGAIQLTASAKLQDALRSSAPTGKVPLLGSTAALVKPQPGLSIGFQPETNTNFLGKFVAPKHAILTGFRQHADETTGHASLTGTATVAVGSLDAMTGMVGISGRTAGVTSGKFSLQAGSAIETNTNFLGRFNPPKYFINVALRQNPDNKQATVVFDSSTNVFVVNYSWPSAPIAASYLYSFNRATDGANRPLSATSRLAVTAQSSATGSGALSGRASQAAKASITSPTVPAALAGRATALAKTLTTPAAFFALKAVTRLQNTARDAMAGIVPLLGLGSTAAKSQVTPSGTTRLLGLAASLLKIPGNTVAALVANLKLQNAQRLSLPTGKATLFGQIDPKVSAQPQFHAGLANSQPNISFIGRFTPTKHVIRPAMRMNPDNKQATVTFDSSSNIFVVQYEWPSAPIKASYLYSFNTAQDRISNVEFDPHFIGRHTPTQFAHWQGFRHNTAQDPPPITGPVALTGRAAAQVRSLLNPITGPAEATPHFLGIFTNTVYSLLSTYRQSGGDGSVIGLAGRLVAALKSTQLPLNKGTQVEANPHFLGRFKSPQFTIRAALRQNPDQPTSTTSTASFAGNNIFVVQYEWPSAPLKASYLYNFGNTAQDPPPVTGPVAITGRVAAQFKSIQGGLGKPEANPHTLGIFTGPMFSLLGLLRQGGADGPPVVETNPHFIGRYTPTQLRLLNTLRQGAAADKTVGLASLSGRVAGMNRARPGIAGKLPLAGRSGFLAKTVAIFGSGAVSFPLFGSLKFGIESHNATAGKLTLLARATALVNALAQQGGRLKLVGRGVSLVNASALRSGIANLQGIARTVAKVRSLTQTGALVLPISTAAIMAKVGGLPQVVGSLLAVLGTGTAQVKAQAKPSGKFRLTGIIAGMVQSQTAPSAFFALAARLRLQDTATALFTGTTPLAGLVTNLAKVRPNSIPVALLLGRLATAVNAQLATVANFPLVAKLTTMVGALVAPTGAAAMTATATLAAKLKPNYLAKTALAAFTALQVSARKGATNIAVLVAVSALKVKASSSYTLSLALSAFAQSQAKTIRPRLTSIANMTAALLSAVSAGQATTVRLAFRALVKTATSLRSSSIGVMGLVGSITTATKVNLAKSHGLLLRATIAFRAAASGFAGLISRLFPDPDYVTTPVILTPASSVYSTTATWRVFVTVPKQPSPSMPQGRDFSPIDPGEVVTNTFDFARWLSPGAQIKSVTSVTCAVASGSTYPDPSASTRLVGAAQIGPSPFSGLPNVCVLQQWGNLVANVYYRFTATVVTTDGQTLVLWAHQACGSGN